jgi:hypothetical protein
MIRGAVKSLVSTLRSLAFRRGVVVVCASAFLFVNFAHSLSHLNTPHTAGIVTAGTVQADSKTFDIDPSSSKKLPASAEHCAVCTSAAMPAPDAAPVLKAKQENIVWTKPADVTPYSLGTDPPPPRILI